MQSTLYCQLVIVVIARYHAIYDIYEAVADTINKHANTYTITTDSQVKQHKIYRTVLISNEIVMGEGLVI